MLAVFVAFAAFVAATQAASSCPFQAAQNGELVNDEEFIRAAYSKFLKDHHGNSNRAPVEVESRFHLFRANYIRAMELNAELNAARGTTGLVAHGVTKFSDMSPDEMRAYTGYVRSSENIRQRYFDSAKDQTYRGSEPALSDWRKEKGVNTAVKNQGQCGSCWAFSAVTAAEGAIGVKYRNNTDTDAELSTQQVVDCDKRSAGCRGGDLPPAYDYITKRGGLIADRDYPYTAKDGTCRDTQASLQSQIQGYEWTIPPCTSGGCGKQDETLLSQKIAEKGPAAICVYVTNDWYSYTGPEPLSASCGYDYYSLNHCITLDGLIEEKGQLAWVARNSWGTSWGIGGFIKFPFGKNSCGLADEVAHVIVA